MLKDIIQSSLRPLGIQLVKVSTKEKLAEIEKLKKIWLTNMKIKTIIDIGANTGQFAKDIHQLLPDAMLYSFEPLKDCYEELVSNFQGVSKFQAFNLALGNEIGKREIYRNEYSPSSSVLNMTDLHKTFFPYTKNAVVQQIEMVKLDDIANQLKLDKPILIKLDVQGFEDKVIAGGKSVFNQADIIIAELSLEELYEGQKLFDDIYKIFINLGFQYRGSYEQLHNPKDGRILQIDGIFIKHE